MKIVTVELFLLIFCMTTIVQIIHCDLVGGDDDGGGGNSADTVSSSSSSDDNPTLKGPPNHRQNTGDDEDGDSDKSSTKTDDSVVAAAGATAGATVDGDRPSKAEYVKKLFPIDNLNEEDLDVLSEIVLDYEYKAFLAREQNEIKKESDPNYKGDNDELVSISVPPEIFKKMTQHVNTMESFSSKASALVEQLKGIHAGLEAYHEANADEDDNDNEQTAEPELTKEELEMNIIYENAMKIMQKARGDKQAAYEELSKIAMMGHKKGQAQMFWYRLLNRPNDAMLEKIKLMLTMLADEGLPEAHTGLGFMYATGIGVNVSQAKALVHYTMAAMGDDPWAQMALGYRYWSGFSVASSCEKALEYYKRVGTKVAAQITYSSGSVVHRVRLLDEIENAGANGGYLDNDVFEYYQLLANKGDVQAQIGLGQLHYQGGRGIPLDHKKAAAYLLPAAHAGNAIAMALLGKIYLEGSEFIEADNETALKYFSKAAELGNAMGQSGLGIMYLQGKGVRKDTTQAFNYFTVAAEQGSVDGQLQLGNMYFSGIGVKRDFKLANKYFNLASQSGHVLAYYNLAQMHALGLGMIRSCPTAVELFKNVAERGKWSERLMMAHQDYRAYKHDDAFMQYALAAELGYEVAQSNAAFLLDRGIVTLFDDRNEELVRALQYWGRAAAQGYSAAQVKLGDYHYYGLGTSIDYDTAASHYRMASEQQHNAQAMFNLGYMHEQGLGMQKDWHLAKRCYDLAAETSADAKVPVALALLKLSLMFKVENLKDSPFRILLELDENIASNWDLYLITILTLLLGLMIYLRRPPGPILDPPPRPAAAAAPVVAGAVPVATPVTEQPTTTSSTSSSAASSSSVTTTTQPLSSISSTTVTAVSQSPLSSSSTSSSSSSSSSTSSTSSPTLNPPSPSSPSIVTPSNNEQPSPSPSPPPPPTQ